MKIYILPPLYICIMSAPERAPVISQIDHQTDAAMNPPRFIFAHQIWMKSNQVPIVAAPNQLPPICNQNLNENRSAPALGNLKIIENKSDSRRCSSRPTFFHLQLRLKSKSIRFCPRSSHANFFHLKFKCKWKSICFNLGPCRVKCKAIRFCILPWVAPTNCLSFAIEMWRGIN